MNSLKLLVFLVFLVFLVVSILVTTADKGAKWPKVLLIGDSITQGSYTPDAPWSALLSQYFIRKADVVNRGLSGYTTRGYIREFKTAVEELPGVNVGAVLIFLGANDCVKPPSPARVDVREFETNLKELVHQLELHGVSKNTIIIASPAPVYGRTDRDPEPYVQVALKSAVESNVTFLDVNADFKKHPDHEKLFVDGLHFNSEGANFFYSLVKDPIENKLKEYKGVDQLKDNFPEP